MRALVFIMSLMTATGCMSLRSRYAMEDPVYAEKYEHGADRFDLLGKAKQALDARHTAGLGGLYASGGIQTRPESGKPIAGGDLGRAWYGTSWFTGRLGLSTYVGQGDEFYGLEGGVRVQTPSRLAPFVGIGMFHGYSEREEPAENDWVDNDDDGFIDEWGEKKTVYSGWLSTVYPEVGAHFWLNGRIRLSAFGKYFITTEGRSQDAWFIGGQATLFRR